MESLLFAWAHEGRLARQRGSLSMDGLKLGAAGPTARHTSEPTVEEDTPPREAQKASRDGDGADTAILVGHVA